MRRSLLFIFLTYISLKTLGTAIQGLAMAFDVSNIIRPDLFRRHKMGTPASDELNCHFITAQKMKFSIKDFFN